jgi:hypothetical protein
VFLAGWPEVAEPDAALLAEIAEVRRIVELGRQARSTSDLKLRQPLRRLIVAGSGLAGTHAGEIADELRVKEVVFGEVDASELRVKPNLPVLGPKLGPALPEVRTALAEGRFEELEGGRVQVNGHVLEPEEVLVERIGKEGWAVATDGAVTVALDTGLDDELRLEARLNDLIREIQTCASRPASRSPTGSGSGFRTRSCSLRRPHRRGDARGLGRARPRAAPRASLTARGYVALWASASCSSRRSSTGRRNSMSSSTKRCGAMSVTPRRGTTRTRAARGSPAPRRPT